jgi:hypothetical protein
MVKTLGNPGLAIFSSTWSNSSSCLPFLPTQFQFERSNVPSSSAGELFPTGQRFGFSFDDFPPKAKAVGFSLHLAWQPTFIFEASSMPELVWFNKFSLK